MYTGLGSDRRNQLIDGIYGEFRIGRQNNMLTSEENFLYQKYYMEFLKWASANNKLYKTYESDIKKLKLYQKLRYLFTLGGVLFAATIVNPNYVSSKSYYMRKFNVLFCGAFGWHFMQKLYLDKERRVELRLQYHLPWEVRRAVQDKDWRYFEMIEDPEKLYDPVTNKPY